MSYTYDLFLSYRRRTPVGDWVHNHFLPQMKAWLGTTMRSDPAIFVDTTDITPGSSWPERLRSALKGSRCLVSVWSPDYFRSAWCLAEWRSMRAREVQVGMRTDANPGGLIYPVVFHDGESFPLETRGIQHRDLREWNYPVKSFEQTVGYVDFVHQVQLLSAELAQMVAAAPAWRADWPIELPEPDPAPAPGLLRF